MFLLELFNWSKSLEEIDAMDIGRIMQVVDAKAIRDVEELRRQQMAGKVKELDTSVWDRIKTHDRLLWGDS